MYWLSHTSFFEEIFLSSLLVGFAFFVYLQQTQQQNVRAFPKVVFWASSFILCSGTWTLGWFYTAAAHQQAGWRAEETTERLNMLVWWRVHVKKLFVSTNDTESVHFCFVCRAVTLQLLKLFENCFRPYVTESATAHHGLDSEGFSVSGSLLSFV